MEILGLIGSALSGGLLGVLGTGLQAFFQFKQKKADHEHELAMRGEDRKEMLAEAELRREELKISGEIKTELANIDYAKAETIAETELQQSSYESDKATYSTGFKITGSAGKFLLVLVDVIRGLMRPVLTLYCVGLLTWVAHLLYKVQGGVIADAANLWAEIIGAVIMLATTTVTWWFGSRRLKDKGE